LYVHENDDTCMGKIPSYKTICKVEQQKQWNEKTLTKKISSKIFDFISNLFHQANLSISKMSATDTGFRFGFFDDQDTPLSNVLSEESIGERADLLVQPLCNSVKDMVVLVPAPALLRLYKQTRGQQMKLQRSNDDALDGLGGDHRPPAPSMVIPRPSLTAPEVQLKRTDKAWKPIRQQDAKKDAETVQTDVSVNLTRIIFAP